MIEIDQVRFAEVRTQTFPLFSIDDRTSDRFDSVSPRARLRKRTLHAARRSGGLESVECLSQEPVDALSQEPRPLIGAWREVADSDGNAEFVGEFRQPDFPQTQARAISSIHEANVLHCHALVRFSELHWLPTPERKSVACHSSSRANICSPFGLVFSSPARELNSTFPRDVSRTLCGHPFLRTSIRVTASRQD